LDFVVSAAERPLAYPTAITIAAIRMAFIVCSWLKCCNYSAVHETCSFLGLRMPRGAQYALMGKNGYV
jgi:hypothetical protein